MAHSSKPKLLMIVPMKWAGLAGTALGSVEVVVAGKDSYEPADIHYVLSFRPPQGLLASLPNLKAAFSLGAGVDGFLSDPSYPKHVPLVRFVDRTLSAEMAQYVLMHVLIHHRMQRFFDDCQKDSNWRQRVLERRTEETHIGFLGLGEIGSYTAGLLVELGFPVRAWTRSRKAVPGVTSFAGPEEFKIFLGKTDILINLLALTRETVGILNASTFAALPQDAVVINVARGGHLIESDLLEALESGHLSGAVLDVFEQEPLQVESPLWRHPKVTVTPHIAAISQPAVVLAYVRDGIAAFERGEVPPTVVDVNAAY
ncbi:glyoxylate/hydroxypyruvate reductase A [Rhizomicrobium palustre]|uniref:Glyoxylate/hydroxypyruvate reductase A n=1 Tax=Rhizomicrobium palustre TaxID=189966 RepID=A0A846MWU5_9PROT|nr:glyoxylate/hydroxypyruvate reductase A [Rhizomicrobium palustre]NIK87876.1 glyoxylate/hydroxypyruvate reductase A [Rhizomicrobium palustre]